MRLGGRDQPLPEGKSPELGTWTRGGPAGKSHDLRVESDWSGREWCLAKQRMIELERGKENV